MATITLYLDPQDMQRPDEEVELVRRVMKHSGAQYYGLETWVVKFDDGFEDERLVHESQIPIDLQIPKRNLQGER